MVENQMSDTNSESYFYHSFPRRGRNQKNQKMIQKGLAILDSICNNGLLLTPESIDWEEPLEDGTLGNRMRQLNKSCSFTEIPIEKLNAHSDKFGSFSLEFEIDVLRKLGAIPVFYLPRAQEGDNSLESLASSLMVRLGEIQELLNNLRQLEKWADVNPEILRSGPTLTICGQDRIGRFSSDGIKDVIAFCKGPSQPLKIMRNALRAICGFLYPAEDYHYTKMMDYYKQREWRIIANMSFHGDELTHPITDENVKEDLIRSDPDFFQREMNLHHERTAQRIDLCQFFPEFDGKKLIEYAHRVIVPTNAVAPANEILSKLENPPEVIDLKSLFPPHSGEVTER